ncbi:hypothetical protein [Amycolatopsis sp.]|jgi:hypothetical protein|uniref:hypothetical protein n=1 Tax=Amycolatopsis sp. TaxID=37632 RepID=UPI002DFCC158|nr:hypothetical protein [Amycolatopsis sp.]
MPDGNPLVAAAPQDGNGPGPLTAGNGDYGYAGGIGIAESAMDSFNGIKDGDWVGGGLGVLSLAGEAASAAIDPFGYLMSSVASFLMEHIQPLKDMLDSLAGDPPVIQSYSETWANVAKSLEESQVTYANAVKNGTAGWTGSAADAYRKQATEQADAIAGAATAASTISTVVMIMGEVVAFVREFVRQLIADLIGKLISWVMETVFSLGFGTPVVVAQAVTAISAWAVRIADKLKDLLETIRRVSPLLGKLGDVFAKIIKILGKIAGKVTGLDVVSTKSIKGSGFATRGGGGSGGGSHGGGTDGPDGDGGSGSGDGGSGTGDGGSGSGDSGSGTGDSGSGGGDSGGGNGSGQNGAGDGSSAGSGGPDTPSSTRTDTGSGDSPSGTRSGDGSPSNVRDGNGSPARGGDSSSPAGDGGSPSPAGDSSPSPARGDSPSHAGDSGSPTPTRAGSDSPSHAGDSSPSPARDGGGSPSPARSADSPSHAGDGSPSHARDNSPSPARSADSPSHAGDSSPSPARDSGGSPSHAGDNSPSRGADSPSHAGDSSPGPARAGDAPSHSGSPSHAGDGSPAPRSDSGAPSRPADSTTSASGLAPSPTPRTGDPGSPMPSQRGGGGDGSPSGIPPQGQPMAGGMPPGGAPGGAPGGTPGGRAPASGWTGTPGSPGAPTPRTPDTPGPRTPDTHAPRTPDPVARGPQAPAHTASGTHGPGNRPGGTGPGHTGPGHTGPDGNGPGGPHRDTPDGGSPGDPDGSPHHHQPERLTPDEVNQRHSEGTPAGSSYHRADPDMGDLPHRVQPDPDGRYTVDVHVTPDGHARIGNQHYTPEEFADILRRNGDYDGRPIRLIGCDAGSNDFAKRLSRELDTEVMAPSKPAWTDSNGRVFSSDYEVGPDGKMRPKIPPNGEWDVHSPDGTARRASDDGFTPDTHHADKQDVDVDSARDRGKDFPSPHDIEGGWQEPPHTRVHEPNPLHLEPGERFYDPSNPRPLEPDTKYEITDSTGRKSTFYTDGTPPPDTRITHVDATAPNTNLGNDPFTPVGNPDANHLLPETDYRVDTGDGRFEFHTDDAGSPVLDIDSFDPPPNPTPQPVVRDWDPSRNGDGPFSNRPPESLEPNSVYHVYSTDAQGNDVWHGTFYTAQDPPPRFTHIETWPDNSHGRVVNPETGDIHTMRDTHAGRPEGLPLPGAKYKIGDHTYHTDAHGNSAVSYEPDYSSPTEPRGDTRAQTRTGAIGQLEHGGTYRGGHSADHATQAARGRVAVAPEPFSQNNHSGNPDNWAQHETNRHTIDRQGATLGQERIYYDPPSAPNTETPDRKHSMSERIAPDGTRTHSYRSFVDVPNPAPVTPPPPAAPATP